MKSSWMMLVAGIASGIALVVACQHAGTPASASPNDCAVWQYTSANAYSSLTPNVQLAPGPSGSADVYDAPPGWEPIGDRLRRCKP